MLTATLLRAVVRDMAAHGDSRRWSHTERRAAEELIELTNWNAEQTKTINTLGWRLQMIEEGKHAT